MSNSNFEAVLWDMDGVIADTGIYHFQAWQDVFGKRGASFTWEDFQRGFGRRNDTIIRSTIGKNISPEELDAIAEEKEANYRERVSRNITPLPGAVALIKALREQGVRQAIASSAPLENIRLIIGGLGIEECFQAIVYGREVSVGKPSPEVFLLAARKLGAAPDGCVVIEDAVAGVAGAKSAGMKCLAVTNSHARGSLKEADIVADSLEGVGLADLAALFSPATDN
jgi:beta-phosphoglucomutase family hydrolase